MIYSRHPRIKKYRRVITGRGAECTRSKWKAAHCDFSSGADDNSGDDWVFISNIDTELLLEKDVGGPRIDCDYNACSVHYT